MGGGGGEKGLAKGERKGSMGEGPYFLRQQSFEFTRNCIVQNLQNGRSKM